MIPPHVTRTALRLVLPCAVGALWFSGCVESAPPPESPGLHGVALAGVLACAITATLRRPSNPLVRPLSLLGYDLALWNAALLLWSLTQQRAWHLVASAAALMAAPLVLHLILIFVGAMQRTRALLMAWYALHAAIAIGQALATFAPDMAPLRLCASEWTQGLALTLTGAFSMLLLARHIRRAPSTNEENRARLLLVALVLAGVLDLSEPLSLVGLEVPRLGALASLVGMALASLVVLRLRLRGRDLSTLSTTYGSALGAVGIVAYLEVFHLARFHPSVLAPGTVLVTAGLLVAIRQGVTTAVVERQRLEQLATLGRFAAQMAHDLKNPLAALKGAAQFLKEEHVRRGGGGEDGDFLDLILQEIDRMHRVVDNYQRLGRVEAIKTSLDINEVVRAVMALQSFAGGHTITVTTEYDPSLPPCMADRDLLENALKNLVRNAFEAMPLGGVLSVRTGMSAPAEAPGVVIRVEDSGMGMDALTRERAMESFYTTKPQGSGLGLAFVRRVVEAHDGDLTLTSREGAGTIARIRLPL